MTRGLRVDKRAKAMQKHSYYNESVKRSLTNPVNAQAKPIQMTEQREMQIKQHGEGETDTDQSGHPYQAIQDIRSLFWGLKWFNSIVKR